MITLALIGVGKWGKNYLNTANTIKGCLIKYVCSQTLQTLDSLPDSYTKVSSPNDLLKYSDIDGIIIATPAVTHFSIAKQFLSYGFNLLIEKPLTVNYKEALQLYKIWQTKKPKILVAHTFLYNPAFHKFKEIFENINNIKYISFEGFKSPIRKDIPVIWDWGPHPISILLSLIKHPLSQLKAYGNYDTVSAHLTFTNGIEAKINISWFGAEKIRKLVAEGKKGKIELDDTNTNNQKVTLYSDNQKIEHPHYNLGLPLKIEFNEFVQALQNKKKITSDINLGINVVKILSAIEKSVNNKGLLIKLHD